MRGDSARGDRDLGDVYPHEIHFSPEDSSQVFVAAARLGGKGAMLRVDLKKKKVVEEIGSSLAIPAHFRFLGSDRKFLVLGTHPKPSVEIIENGRSYPLHFNGPFTSESTAPPESLNVAFDPLEPDMAWVAIFRSGLVVKVDCKRKQIVDSIKTPGARDVFRFMNEMYLADGYGTGEGTRLKKMGKTLTPIESKKGYGNTSHSCLIQAV